MLCEKFLIRRFEFLFKRGLSEKELPLVNIGRHFVIDGSWVVIGRNKIENDIIESINVGELIVPNFIGPSALLLDNLDGGAKEKVEKLIKAYSKQGSLKERKKFEEFKI